MNKSVVLQTDVYDEFVNLIYDRKTGAYVIATFVDGHELVVTDIGVADLDAVMRKYFEEEMEAYQTAIALS